MIRPVLLNTCVLLFYITASYISNDRAIAVIVVLIDSVMFAHVHNVCHLVGGIIIVRVRLSRPLLPVPLR
jgi:hypothetical protein